MLASRSRLIAAAALLVSSAPLVSLAQPRAASTGNPILPGWYADPEAHVFGGQYWIFPTYSAPYNQQTFMDAFSSPDLVTWTKHAHVLDTVNVKWAKRAMWAPSIVQKDGWYYLFFGANDIQNDTERGGIGVARARTPNGPFIDYLGKPLIDRFHNGAQPIDQFVFQDRDGAFYIVYGGWKHCSIAKLNSDFTGFVPFADGTTFKEITPSGYVEGAFMFLKDGKYYFMWSEGGWTGPNYAVAYAVGATPFGPFERVGTILKQDSTIATGAGHHSVLHAPGSPQWYIVYHRRPLGETDRNARVVSIEALHFDSTGKILPVVLTKQGVAADPLQPPLPATPPYQAISLLGDTLRTFPLAADTRAKYEMQLAEARLSYAHAPTNVDSLIWYARRLGYLGRLRESIEMYSRGIAMAPNNPWLYRHRGHRYISVRNFSAAVADLEKATALVAGKPDEVEEDGQPNAKNTPIGTLQSNIGYHLALAYYLQGKYDKAAQVARRELSAASNDDRRVSMAHWLYMSLRRQGKTAEAAAVVAPMTRDMQVIENQAYHRLILLYKGELPPDSVLSVGPSGELSVSDASVAYGVAAWYAYTGREAQALTLWRRIVAGGQWGAFGTIAAEADLARRRTR